MIKPDKKDGSFAELADAIMNCNLPQPATTPTPETDAEVKAYDDFIQQFSSETWDELMRDKDKLKSILAQQPKDRWHFARKLERERDEARAINKLYEEGQKLTDVVSKMGVNAVEKLQAELAQLRQMCNEWQLTAMMIMESSNDIHAACERLRPMIKKYTTLPHIIKAKGKE
jgi:hypothetical protein